MNRGHRPDDPALVCHRRDGADTAANGHCDGTPSKSKQFARCAGAGRSSSIPNDAEHIARIKERNRFLVRTSLVLQRFPSRAMLPTLPAADWPGLTSHHRLDR
jgi:hypothetical protein